MATRDMPDTWFYAPIIFLGINFIFRLINQAKILWQFPLDMVNDMSSYMAQLFFLRACGFHALCSYWYNGFTTFHVTPPGWYFFTLPLYLLFGDVKIAAYASMLLIFCIAFFAILYFGKRFSWSIPKRISFFLFFFANAIAIGNFIRLGRVHELFAWLAFCIFAFIILFYKDRPLHNKFFLVSIFYALIIISYLAIGIMSTLLFLGLFLAKKDARDNIKIIIAGLLGFLLSAFWTIPFLLHLPQSFIPYERNAEWLLDFSSAHLLTNIAAFIIPALFLIAFYFYYTSHGKKQHDLLFYSPLIILAILLFTRLIVLVPILNDIWQDPYLIFFIFFTLYLFFSTRFAQTPQCLKTPIPYGILAFTLLSVSISIFITPYFAEHTAADTDLIQLFPSVHHQFAYFTESGDTPYVKAVYSYAPAYYNLTTPGGWYHHLKTPAYLDQFEAFNTAFFNHDCSTFLSFSDQLHTRSFITHDEDCAFLDACGLEHIKTQGIFCLYEQ